jgi:hypothetical protein
MFRRNTGVETCRSGYIINKYTPSLMHLVGFNSFKFSHTYIKCDWKDKRGPSVGASVDTCLQLMIINLYTNIY